MMKINDPTSRFLKRTGITFLIFAGFVFYALPYPWKSWAIADPSKVQVQDLRVYLKFGNSSWCGNLKYSNDVDCEFRLFVTNPKSDTLYNRVIKAPAISKYDKDLEFAIINSIDVSVYYIPVNVPKNAKIKFYFKNYGSCRD